MTLWHSVERGSIPLESTQFCMKKLFIKNTQGRKLAAIIETPKNKQAIGPVALVLPGFLAFKEEPHLTKLADELTKMGYCVLRFDPLGFGESDGTLINDYLFSNYLRDAWYLLGWLKKKRKNAAGPVIVAGHSMGAFLALLLSSRDKEISAAIAIEPPLELKVKKGFLHGLKNRLGEMQSFKKIASKIGRWSSPLKNWQDFKQYNGRDFVSNITCPKLIILGKEDKLVPPADTRKLFDLAKEPKTLIELSGVGHFYKKYPEEIRLINEKVKEFLRSTNLEN